MRFHLPSLAVGAALALLVGLLSAQNLVNSPDLNVRLTEPAPVYTQGHPRNVVKIEEGTPFTVPSDRLLVITSMGHGKADSSGFEVWLSVNGVHEARVSAGAVTAPYRSSLTPIPGVGIVAQGGDTVDVKMSGASLEGRAWGYLADD